MHSTLFRTTLRGLLLLTLIYTAGCSKDLLLPEDLPGEEGYCLLTSYTCVIDGDVDDIVHGIVRRESLNGVQVGLTDSSSWGEINYRDDESVLYFDFNNVEATLHFTSAYVPNGATYLVGSSIEETISGDINYNGELEYVNVLVRNFNTWNFYNHTIDSIVYEDGNIVSYIYTMSLDDYPYTIIEQEEYQMEYIGNAEYDSRVYPNNIFFMFNYMPVLGRDYSLGERFDPQPFSKYLLTEKRNMNNYQVVLDNDYEFTSDLRTKRLIQTFDGGNAPHTLVWNYRYSCDE